MSTSSGVSEDQRGFWSPQDPSSSTVSSPSQRVPGNSDSLAELVSSVGIEYYDAPYLKIIEQPQALHKFRYLSEMDNSHGCIFGRTYEKNKSIEKTYPEVELYNFNGNAKIRCELVQKDNHYEHPHKLKVVGFDDQTVEVPVKDNCRVRFIGLCIIHTKVKNVTDWLVRAQNTNSLSQEQEENLRKEMKELAKIIDLNSVRLKFSAVHMDSGDAICDSVYSTPIENTRTNVLKICRMSRTNTSVRGCDDVIMLVEKVVKKNIKIRFFETSENGDVTWEQFAFFSERDVHYQTAIVFRTPPYVNQDISRKVKVWVELVRPSDGKTSEPREFFYTPDPHLCRAKKRKFFHTSEQPSTSFVGHTGDWNNVPRPRLQLSSKIAAAATAPGPSLSEASFLDPIAPATAESTFDDDLMTFNTLIDNGDFNEYFYNALSADLFEEEPHFQNGREEVIEDWQSDSGRVKQRPSDLYDSVDRTNEVEPQGDIKPIFTTDYLNNIREMSSGSMYRENEIEPQGDIKPIIFYDDQITLQKMIVKLQNMVKLIRVLDANKKHTLRAILEGLFDVRLSNGDTFLHLIVSSQQPFVNYVINVVYDFDMKHLLNLKNASMQTILHLAVINNLSNLAEFLLSKGCDPMLEDVEGNNAVHYGVMYPACLEPVLAAIEKLKIPHDLDACNNEKQTPLHLAVLHERAACTHSLLARGADHSARDAHARTPLLLAAQRAARHVLHALLDHVPAKVVDEVDDRGYTALQIICDQEMTEDSLEIIRLLLDKKADPMKKREGHNLTAWRLARDKPTVRELMRKYIDEEPNSSESEDSEDDFQSADEGDLSDPDDVSCLVEPLSTMAIAPESDILQASATG